jgi:hypothetical protein
MALVDLIWRDFSDAKYGDEYLVLYSARQRWWKKAFKFITLTVSAGGVISAFIDAKVPTVILCSIVCIIQVLTVFENSFISTEKDIEEFIKLRLLYCEHAGELELLFVKLFHGEISDANASENYYKLKKHKDIIIEELDTKLNVHRYEKLMNIAEARTHHYLKRYI